MERRSTSTVHRVASFTWERLLDLLYPPRCGGCDRRGTLLCDDCYSRVKSPYLDAQVESIDAFASAGLFKGPLREAVHKLKYYSDTPLCKPLARLLSEALSRDDPWSVLDGNPPMLMPVPLHSHKERVRGYNQSALLARELSRLTGWPIQSGLVRIKETQPQVGLSARGAPAQRSRGVLVGGRRGQLAYPPGGRRLHHRCDPLPMRCHAEIRRCNTSLRCDGGESCGRG